MNVKELVLFILVLKTTTSNAKYCMDISDDKKELIFKEFDSIFRKYNNEIIVSKANPQHNHSNGLNINLYRENRNCTSIKKNTTYLSDRAMCPWVYRIKIRSNRTLSNKYPVYRREAHCLCSDCDANMKHKCMPVLESMPCLERLEKCNADGYYMWVPTIERISVACVCASI